MIFEALKPLTNTTDQLLDVVLSGNPYTLRILWNERHGYYSLSVFERDGPAIVEGVKMVKNYPLLGRFKNPLLPAGELFFVDPKNRPTRPGYEAFTDYLLTYFDAEDVPAVVASTQAETAALSGSIWDGGLSVWDTGSTTWDA